MTKENKIKEERTTLVIEEGNFGILRDSRNWIVSQKNKALSGIDGNKSDFDAKTNSYHPTLTQAMVELSHRMLDASISKATKDRALKLDELVEIVKVHDRAMRKMIMGRSEVKS